MATKAKSQKSKNSKESTKTFSAYLAVKKNCKISTIEKREELLHSIGAHVDLNTLDINQIGEYVAWIRQNRSPNYVRNILLTLTYYAEWMRARGRIADELFDEIDEIPLPDQVYATKDKKDMLTDEEFSALVNRGAQSSRDRAFLALTFEGALRAKEAYTLKWGDLVWDASGISLNVGTKGTTKTEKPRYIRLVVSVDYINRWKADYPGEPSGSAPVFITPYNGEMLEYGAARGIVRRAKARVPELKNKKIHLHLLRHSRVNQMIDQDVPEVIIKKVGWGSANTRTFGLVYEHMQTKTIDDAILAGYGMKARIEKPRGSSAWECPSCGAILTASTKFCPNDGTPRDSPARIAGEMDREKALKILASLPPVAIEALKALSPS